MFGLIYRLLSPAGWCCAVLGCYLVPKGRAAWMLGSSERTSGCVDMYFSLRFSGFLDFSDKNTNI